MSVAGDDIGRTICARRHHPGVAVAIVVLGVLVPFLALEAWVRVSVFEHVSYSNSRSVDASWKALNAVRDWTILYIGDSEVRWGFDPDIVDHQLAKAGLRSRGFNMAIDGFSGALSQAIIRYLGLKERMPQLRVAVIGTQLIEAHNPRPIQSFGDFGCEGALQRPLFSSAMARDLGFGRLCQEPRWTTRLVAPIERLSALIRYRQALRAALVGWSEKQPVLAFNSLALAHRPNGFQPHRPIREVRQNYEWEFGRRRALIATTPTMRGPLDWRNWLELTAPGGYFDRWADGFLAQGVLPVFAALPTNPVLIDLQERRPDYARNRTLLREWSVRRGDVVFVDLGIKDDFDGEGDFADFRHLSVHGAERFSRELGQVLAAHPLVRRALNEGERGLAAALPKADGDY